MQSQQVTRMSKALKALSDSNRIRILEILVTGEYCVSDLVERLQIDQPKVSHHLAILRSANVIKSRRDGRHINYSLRSAVHRREETAEGPAHVFDLLDLCVTFRFPAAGAAPGGSGTAAVGEKPQVHDRRPGGPATAARPTPAGPPGEREASQGG